MCSSCRCFKVRHTQRLKLKQKHGGVCKRCGCDDINILHFHHLNPENKLFNLAGAYHSVNYKAIEEEADKCEFICPNCHAKEHVKNNQRVIDYYNLK